MKKATLPVGTLTTNGRITAGSYSRLEVFNNCRYRAYLSFVKRIPEPTNKHAQRGIDIHKYAEDYICWHTDELSPELKYFEPELNRLRELYKSHPQYELEVENMWCYDKNWAQCPSNAFDNIRFRIKTDVALKLTKKTLLVIDVKSGKRYGNEIKHAMQTQLYGVGGFLRYPGIETVITELWYTDHNLLVSASYNMNAVNMHYNNWRLRTEEMLECTEFMPNPSRETCRYCPYGKTGSGHCTVGIHT